MGNRKRQPIKQIRMNKKGETLVETIVSFVIVIIALGAITALISSATTMNRKAQEKSDKIEAAATKVEQNAGQDEAEGTLDVSIGGQIVAMEIKVKSADLFTYFTYVPGEIEPDPGEEPEEPPDQDEIKNAVDWPDPEDVGENGLVSFPMGAIVKYNKEYYVAVQDTHVTKAQAAAGPSQHNSFAKFTGTILTDEDLNASDYFDKVYTGDLYRGKDGKLYVYAGPGGSWYWPPTVTLQNWFEAS
ncbi:type II secretion system GspH family protein [Anaerovorax odorimutans]|nr:type II secretion system GspH family protein [Anaerovorax odorimutans]